MPKMTEVVGYSDVIDVTLTPHTGANADNDVIAATQEITNVYRRVGGTIILQSLILLDEDDQAVDVDIVFLNADGSVGAEDAVFAPSDTVARTIVGTVSILSSSTPSQYVDSNTSQYAVKTGLGLIMKAGSNTTSLWVAAVCRSGTPTYTAAGLKLKLGILRD